ncbi:SDR family oxidoreductase [Actinospica sp. MGRD01-02]|uniref:SDR family oxidoreductase n=1 Tax=Actinospica acidithermotolerans TaxID=2828514 RepID=A0A941E856_9ACTN|nr:SDR family oxidoreductase [Actinospica acidithermotolerans]MBR7825678.1 SDR family oxidoreductase [Actinospica acidithermotolerans]
MSRIYAVTGSASGIGKATKELLEGQGHRVVGIDRAGAEIEVNLAQAEQRAALGDRVAAATGGALDAVIAVAGVGGMDPLGAEINFFGARDAVVGLRPLLLGSAAPRAVLVSSISVVMPNLPELTELLLQGDEGAVSTLTRQLVADGKAGYIYSSSKRAIAEWVRAAAITDEWAGAGIPLNSVAPGTFVTPMTASFLATEQGRAVMARSVPMPLAGPGRPEVVANLLAWLASEENTHITGQSIFIDGGAEASLRGPRVFAGASFDRV